MVVVGNDVKSQLVQRVVRELELLQSESLQRELAQVSHIIHSDQVFTGTRMGLSVGCQNDISASEHVPISWSQPPPLLQLRDSRSSRREI